MTKSTLKNALQGPGLAFGLVLCAVLSASAQNTWSGGGENENWTNPANWQGNVVPPSDGSANVLFDGAIGLSPNVDQSQAVNRIAFASTASAFVVGGPGLLTVGSYGGSPSNDAAISNLSTVLQTISADLAFGPGGGNSYIYAAFGGLALTGDVALSERRLIFNNSGADSTSPQDITISGNVAGEGFVGKAILIDYSFRGVFTLSGNNTFTGQTEIRDGTLVLAHDNALGLGSADLLVGTAGRGAKVFVQGNHAINQGVQISNSSSDEVVLGGNSVAVSTFRGAIKLGDSAGKAVTLTASAGGTVRMEGNVVTSNGGPDGQDVVTKKGAGTVVLEGSANTYSGRTEVTEGTLLIDGAFGGAGLQITVEADAVLGGSGIVNREVEVKNGGVLLAGNRTDVEAVLTLGGDVTLEENSLIELSLAGDGRHSSLARSGGIWTFSNTQQFLINTAPAGEYLAVITGLTGMESGLDNVALWTVAGAQYAGSTFSFDGSNVNLHLVPEPSSYALLGLAGAGCWFYRLRQRRRRAGALAPRR